MFAASFAAHAVLLAAWLSTRPEPHFVEPPAMAVELLRLRPPQPRPQPPRKPSPAKAAGTHADEPAPETPTAKPAPPSPAPVAPRQLTDEELIKDFHMTPRQIREAPVRDYVWTPGKPRPKCKPAEGYPGPPLPCPGEIVKDPNRPFDVDRDAPDSELARAGRYKRAMKTYRELPGDKGYPGVACAIFHKC